jgi:RHS repeat-associated protein
LGSASDQEVNRRALAVASGGGISVSRSDNDVLRSYQDVNGDGLIDELVDAGSVKVRLNTGNGFNSSMSMDWTGASKIGESSTTGESANIAFTGCIPLPPIAPVVKLCFNPSFSGGRSMSRDKAQINDVDGDGFPDYVTSSQNDGDLKVKRSTIGRTNLLKSVKRPLGASFTLSYKQLGSTYEMPNNVWAITQVDLYDGFSGDGVDSTRTTFAYEGGFFDRHEREFYGFKRVTTRSHDTGVNSKPVYTAVTQTFENDDYFKKGLMVSEVMTDGAGNKFIEKINEYTLRDYKPGSKFPALTISTQKFYEGQAEAGKSTQMKFSYDSIGNVIEYTDEGDPGSDDDISATITYHHIDLKHISGAPKTVIVSGSGVTYRKREAVIDDNTGNLTRIRQFLNDEEVAEYDMEYDEFGNLKKITRPKNSTGQRLSFEYVYDGQVHSYPIAVSNSYGYSSKTEYDFRFGQVVVSTDLNGNEIAFELDNAGRIKNVTGPYEKGGGHKTIEFEYHPDASIPWALTKHFDPSDPNNKLQTVIFIDGLERVLQTKKDVAIYDGEGKPDLEKMSVSGRQRFDAFGRTIKTFYPVLAPANTPAEFIDLEDQEVGPSISTYDVMNRPTSVTLPDQSVTATQYGFDSDRFGVRQFSTKTTDANGKQTEQFMDVRGRVTSVKNYTAEQQVWTSFKYNAINEQVEASDDLGHTTVSVYDQLGRRTERRHPDAGTTTYSYDLAGNLRELVTANLASEGLAISYSYDFERLKETSYPQNPENNVRYTYGEPGASDNRAGRIVIQEDAAGAQEFFYGPLGEMVKNIRTVIIPQFDEQTYTTEWTYDTWNRLTSMTYADGEKVSYTYNQGGLLRSMDGKKKSASYSYVKQLGYDKFEQRVFLAYGNGTKTSYDYEPDRRRLKHLTAQTSTKRRFMDNVYEYDKVNNILGLKNNAPIPAPNLMGGSSEYTYSYDDLYRLTSAEGHYKGANDEQTYMLNMIYNSVGGVTRKTQQHESKGVVQKKTSYDMSYTYGTEQPHAPIHIGDHAYIYDDNGNQTGWTDDLSGQKRKLMWDEENRIRAVYDNGAIFHYTYDASGERVLKGQSMGQRVFVNGEWKAGSGQMGNYTVYVNPYLVLKSGGYTKHYYIESERIVSKIGGGWDNTGHGPLRAGDGKVDYITKGKRIFDGIVKNLKFLGADGQILTAGKSGKVPPGQVNGTGGGGGTVNEAFRYFYHPDHLGSTSYITDAAGEVYQHLEYFAFGETFVEEHSNTDRTPYLFNGKELDEETGLYYYGARYYDPTTSAWLSVDPKADEFLNMSPYAYAANNPVLMIDPDGQAWKPTVDANTGRPTGYQWIDEAESYNDDGSLKAGLYHQAIFFTENGTYDSESDFNMGSATAHVYKADGTVETFDASTYPADPDSYATVPEGTYEAKVGLHKGDYTALRMGDVGTADFGSNKIQLGKQNPAFSDGRTYAEGINIHKAGQNNKTGMTTTGSPISAGCSLIDRNKWDSFIAIFNTDAQKNNIVGVTISRSYRKPLNMDIPFITPRFLVPADNTRVFIPRRIPLTVPQD